MHVSCTFKGNKNKNGSKLGYMRNINKDATTYNTVPQDTTNSESTLKTATFQFQGNKNGIETKLCAMAVSLYPYSAPVNPQPQLHPVQCPYPGTRNMGHLLVNVQDKYLKMCMQLGTILCQSGLPNFMKLHIPVQTQLKFQSWKKYLDCYWDRQLVDLIQFGFPLDFDRNVVLNSTELNHNSALKYPEHVSNSILLKNSSMELFWALLKSCLFIVTYPPFSLEKSLL